MAHPLQRELAGIDLLLQEQLKIRKEQKTAAERSCVLERNEWEGVGCYKHDKGSPKWPAAKGGRRSRRAEVKEQLGGETGSHLGMSGTLSVHWDKDWEWREGEGAAPQVNRVPVRSC